MAKSKRPKKKSPGKPRAIAGVCRVCGCRDTDCTWCVEDTGQPCCWVDAAATLCSACARAEPLLKLLTRLVKHHKTAVETGDMNELEVALDDAARLLKSISPASPAMRESVQ